MGDKAPRAHSSLAKGNARPRQAKAPTVQCPDDALFEVGERATFEHLTNSFYGGLEAGRAVVGSLPVAWHGLGFGGTPLLLHGKPPKTDPFPCGAN